MRSRPTRRRSLALVLALLLSPVIAAVQPARDVIDRVLAVVAGEIITLSDVRGAIELDLIELPEREVGIGTALGILIDRELMLTEVDRYAPPEPSTDTVAASLAFIRARFSSDDVWRETMAASGFDEDRVRGWIRNTLRIEAYLDQRFGTAMMPTEAEMREYYRRNESRFAREGWIPAFEDVREQISAQLSVARRDSQIREWVADLRRRTDMMSFYED